MGDVNARPVEEADCRSTVDIFSYVVRKEGGIYYAEDSDRSMPTPGASKTSVGIHESHSGRKSSYNPHVGRANTMNSRRRTDFAMLGCYYVAKDVKFRWCTERKKDQ